MPAGLRRKFMRLTVREKDVVRLVCSGLPNRLVARQLGITQGTAKVHLSKIYRKLGVSSRMALVVAAAGSGGRKRSRNLFST